DLGDALADAAGGAGDEADLVVESVHGEVPCGSAWIMAAPDAGGHCLFVRCRAWRGRFGSLARHGSTDCRQLHGYAVGVAAAGLAQLPAQLRRGLDDDVVD